jgi:predicted nucleic acid-binding protein
VIILDGQQPSPRGTPANAILAATIQQGRPRPANDTWIAACALANGLPLATLNTKDFKDFAEHGGLNLIIQAG